MRLYIGLDLGSKSQSEAVAVDESGKIVGEPVRFTPERSSMDEMVATLCGGALPEEVMFISEPTGTIWHSVESYLSSRGYGFFLVSPQKTHDLRRFYKRHAKTDTIDAYTLAKMALVHPEGLFRPSTMEPLWHNLRRGAKKEAKIARLIGDYKRTIQAKAEIALPGISSVVDEVDSPLAKCLYTKYLDPRKAVKLGKARLERSLGKAAGYSEKLFSEIWRCIETAAEIETDCDYDDLRVDIDEDFEVLECLKAQWESVKRRNLRTYCRLDPGRLLCTVYGVGDTLAPAILAGIGDGGRFKSIKHFLSYTGFTPRVEESGQREAKGTRMTKAGPPWLRRALYLAADVARRWDPQLAEVYYRCMLNKGHAHTKALCVVASRLAMRIYAVVKEQRPYELRDVDGRPVTAQEAKAIVEARYKVPEEVRCQRRNAVGNHSMKRSGRPRTTQSRSGCPTLRLTAPLPKVNEGSLRPLDTT